MEYDDLEVSTPLPDCRSDLIKKSYVKSIHLQVMDDDMALIRS